MTDIIYLLAFIYHNAQCILYNYCCHIQLPLFSVSIYVCTFHAEGHNAGPGEERALISFC